LRVFITGITGFVGTHLCRHLSKRGYEIWGTHYPPDRSLPKDLDKARVRPCNILDRKGLWQFIRRVRPEAVIHLAALSYVPESLKEPLRTYEVNFLGTLILYEALLRLGGCGKVLFIGSADCYGQGSLAKKRVTESAPFLPENPYAASKAAADIASFEYFRSRSLPVVRVRPFNHTGPGQSDRFVVSDFAHQIARIEAKKQEPVLKVGNLGATRDFLDVRDVVRAYELLLRKGTPGEAYNIASGRKRRIGDVVRTLLSMSRASIDVKTVPERYREDSLSGAAGSYARLEKATGWRPRIPFEKTLADVLRYWRKFERK